MHPEQLAAIEAGLAAERDRGGDIGASLCATCVEVLEVAGAGIMLMIDGDQTSSLGASNSTIGVVEDLQFTFGEGPCIEAFHRGEPVFEPDLADPTVGRWPAFSGPALAAGVRAVFGFPVMSGAVGLGALDVYFAVPGDLDAVQIADAVTLTGVIARTVLAIQANTAPGTIPDQFEPGINHRAVVHQASGMLSAQLDLPVADALARIKAHAYAESTPINDVARAILAHDLYLESKPR